METSRKIAAKSVLPNLKPVDNERNEAAADKPLAYCEAMASTFLVTVATQPPDPEPADGN